MVTSMADLLDRALRIAKAQEGVSWWRGLADAGHELVPGVFRPNRGPDDERNLIGLFRLHAPTRYAGRLPENINSWLFFMQHYRLPTRLLDWTESVLVAAYFAACAQPEIDGAVWALNPLLLNRETIGEPRFGVQGDPIVRPLFEAATKGVIQAGVAEVVAIVPDEVDLRMLVQLGRATIHNDRVPLEKRPSAGTYLKRLTIPSHVKAALRAELDWLGVRESNLFPDLEHLATELASRRFGAG